MPRMQDLFHTWDSFGPQSCPSDLSQIWLRCCAVASSYSVSMKLMIISRQYNTLRVIIIKLISPRASVLQYTLCLGCCRLSGLPLNTQPLIVWSSPVNIICSAMSPSALSWR